MYTSVKILFVLFSTSSGLPVPPPNSFTTQSACNAAAATYENMSKHNVHFQCIPMRDVISKQ